MPNYNNMYEAALLTYPPNDEDHSEGVYILACFYADNLPSLIKRVVKYILGSEAKKYAGQTLYYKAMALSGEPYLAVGSKDMVFLYDKNYKIQWAFIKPDGKGKFQQLALQRRSPGFRIPDWISEEQRDRINMLIDLANQVKWGYWEEIQTTLRALKARLDQERAGVHSTC